MLAQHSVDRIKRGLTAPLLFLGLAAAAYGSSEASPSLWSAALLALAIALWLLPETNKQVANTALFWSVAALAAWITLQNFFANPSYTPGAPYYSALLFGGYLVGRRAAPQTRTVYQAAIASAVVLAGWALAQQALLSEQRAHGLLVTPATLASTVNLVLAPGLVLIVFGVRPAALPAALVLLAVALGASQSRGGWIALGAAIAISALMGWRAGLRPAKRDVQTALAVLAAGALGAWALRAATPTTGLEHAMFGEQAGQSLQARVELYALAIQDLAKSSWLLGSGFSSFFYFLQAGRGAVPSYDQSATYFVHNDYLQILLELGVPGLAGLLLLVVLPFGQAWRALPGSGEQRVALIAVIAAIASMAIHGLADFPFFIPVCILMYGAALGLCDAMAPSRAERGAWIPAPAWRIAVAAVAAFAIWILGKPVAAEAASLYAQRQWLRLENERAAYWFEAARRLEARDWRYHWYAGQFWTSLAVARADPAAARLADAALAASIAANPREVRSLYDRIVLHRRLRKLLAAPADPETMRAWSARAVELAPTHADVLAERARVLKQFPLPTGRG